MIDIKKTIVEICNRLYDRRLISTNSGNISALSKEENIIITPAGMRKFQMTPGDLCVVTTDGRSLTPKKKHSSEYRTHLNIYKTRKDIRAIIHAHPPYSIICSLAGITFDRPILPETEVLLGPIPTVAFASPGSIELADSVAIHLANHNALILERHGVITCGKDLWEAYDRMEEVEHAAKIAYLLSLKH